MFLLAEIRVFGKPIPWSAPHTIRCGKPGKKQWHYHRKDAALIAWQDTIRAAVAQEGPRTPYRDAVMLNLTFYRGTTDEALWGKRWWTAKPARGQPDLTNLVKATEDAVKTCRRWKGKGKERTLVEELPGVIEEDSQVCEGYTRKRYGPDDGVEIRVYAVEG